MTHVDTDALARVARLFKIVQIIEGRRPVERISRADLADACCCSVKTIQRDIDFLAQANVPVDYDASLRSYTLPTGAAHQIACPLSTPDLLALAFAQSWLAGEGSLPFAPQIGAALLKITSVLSPAQRRLFAAASQAVADRLGLARDYSSAPVGCLLDALIRRETLEIVYESRSGSGIETRRIDPYRLDRREGRFLELQAWCHRREEVRTFALDRIRDARLIGEMFIIRDVGLIDKGVVGGMRGGARVVVEAVFDRETAPFARERDWGFDAAFDSAPDGGAVMTGHVLGVEGITKELLRWGRHVAVLGGPELRARMAEEAAAIAAIYDTP